MYDLTTIKRISKNNNEVIVKYIEAFITSSREELKAVDDRIAENRWDEVAEILHKMKTSVAYFGMDHIQQLVMQAEANIKDGSDTNMVESRIREIGRLLAETFQHLREEISRLQDS